MTDVRPQHARRQFSLRWKFAILLVAVLVCVNLLVQGVYYRRLQTSQAEETTAHLAVLQEGFLTMDRRSSLQLERIANQFASEVDELVRKPAAMSASATHIAVDTLQYLTPEGKSLFAWQQEGSGALPPPALVERALGEVGQKERPQTYLDCRQACLQQAFVPALSSEGKEIVVNVSRSNSDVVVDFQQMSHADIALLAGGGKNLPEDPGGVWGRRILVATHAGSLIDVLRELARLQSLDDLRPGTTLWLGERYFAVKAFDLAALDDGGGVTALVISDETANIQAMRHAAWENLALSSFGMVLVGILLGWALGRPMRRVQALSVALPRLADGRFEEMRASVADAQPAGRNTADEIDVLSDAAVALSSQLEQLQGEVVGRTRALHAKVEELDRARGFNELLLDTAPVIIVIHGQDGGIVRMNRFGHELTGWSPATLCNIVIEALIQPPEMGEDPLPRLRAGESQSRQVESALRCAGGERRRVVWLHAGVETELGRVIMSVGMDITMQRETESRLRWLAGHDAITGLLNRESFTRELQDNLADAAARHAGAALLMLDVDHFQDINDSYGQHTGDAVLSQLSGRLRKLCGNRCVLGRLGSDEFAILMMGGDAVGAQALAEAVGQGLADTPMLIDGRAIHLSTTAGVALYPEHGDIPQELLAAAAQALAQAKRLRPGQAHVLTLDAAVRSERRARMQVRDDIAAALNDGRFTVYYQPILDMRSYRVTHCESLVRMLTPEGKIVPPGAFIEVAEQSGQINAITQFVLRKVMRMQAELRRSGQDLTVSVNLAAKAFADPLLLDNVKALLEETGTDPRQLIFEIVESEAIANLSRAQMVMRELTACGARFAFDDFGVGFTSFGYLRELPVHYVKIDQSFVTNLRDRETDRVLVRSMHEMIQRLGLRSVAEGVEDAWTLAYLRDLGIDYCQGYHISRPLPEPPVGDVVRAIEERLAAEAGHPEQPSALHV